MLVAHRFNQIVRFARRLAGRGMNVTCRRRGVRWTLDLDEGIDLSIYLLGAYEPRTLRAYRAILAPLREAVVFDIGANIGAHSLHFARLVAPGGRVFAFEATDYAFGKLRLNLGLNPALAPLVTAQQVYLTADRAGAPPESLCASWPVDVLSDDVHSHSLGRSKSLASARAMTGDDFCRTAGITRLDLLKIDVDGNEHSVLHGFHDTLARFRPVLLVELAPYFHVRGENDAFEQMIRLLHDLRYDFFDANNGRPLPSGVDQLRARIPAGASVNAMLLSRSRDRGAG